MAITWQQLWKDYNPQIKNPNLIYPGDIINFPDGTTYEVVKGDTLSQITVNYNRSNTLTIPEPEPTTETEIAENQAQDDVAPEETTTIAGGDVKETTTETNKSSGIGKRTWNPLGDFSSYTYRISFYSMPPEALNTYVRTGRFSNNDLYLMAQSGGINNSQTTDNNGNLDASRGQGFELDFYIDDLEIETLTNAKENGISANSVNFKFKIIEPYGMTFPTKLVSQQIQLQQIANMKRPVKDQIAALAGHYLISIRFYGYDSSGQIVTSAMYGGSAQDGATAAPLDANATFERSFPVVINKFQFRIDGKSTVYDINAKLVAEQVALGAKRGLVVETLNIQGSTVGEMIGGDGGEGGLLDQLAKAQDVLVNQKKSQQIADEFLVVYEDETIQNSSVVDDKQINKDRVPMTDITNQGTVKASYSAGSKTMEKSRTMSFPAGLPLTQAIDQIVTQSKFISDALTYTDSEEAQATQEGEPTDEVNSKPKTLQWYIVSPVVEVIDWDDLRNDFAYRTTFVIKSYQIPYVKAGNVKYVPRYPGPHKIYNYWYTGKNTEVIAYEQSYNLLYFNAAALTSQNSGINLQSNTPIYQRSAQGADSTGKASGAFDSVNSVKTFLYSPKDQLHAKIRILGDPDFLMPSTSGCVQQIMKKWYGDDFTINPNTGQVFIELVFKQVEDYSNVTGLLNPNGDIDFWDFSNNPAMKSLTTGMVYMVVKVTSRFSKGTFTQEFKTILPNFNELGKDSKSNTSSTEQRSPATTGPTNNTPSREGTSANSGGKSQAELDKLYKQWQANPNSIGKNGSSNNMTDATGAAAANATPNDDTLVNNSTKSTASSGRVEVKNPNGLLGKLLPGLNKRW